MHVPDHVREDLMRRANVIGVGTGPKRREGRETGSAGSPAGWPGDSDVEAPPARSRVRSRPLAPLVAWRRKSVLSEI